MKINFKKSNEIVNLFPTLSTTIEHIIDNDRFLNVIEIFLIRSIIGSWFDYGVIQFSSFKRQENDS